MPTPFDGLAIAQNLAALGFAVFPLRTRAKVPANLNGFKSASRYLEDWQDETGQWWQGRNRNCNVGIATGVEHPDGGYLTVIDIDRHPGKPDGFASWNAWRAGRPPMEQTMSVATPQGGLHLYFLSHEPMPTRTDIRPGIDIKGVGGYVVGAGSIITLGDYVVATDVSP